MLLQPLLANQNELQKTRLETVEFFVSKDTLKNENPGNDSTLHVLQCRSMTRVRVLLSSSWACSPSPAHGVDPLRPMTRLGIMRVHVARDGSGTGIVTRSGRAVEGLQGQTRNRDLPTFTEVHHLDVLVLPPAHVDTVLRGEVECEHGSPIGLTVAVGIVVHLTETGRNTCARDIDVTHGHTVVREQHHRGALSSAPHPRALLPEAGQEHRVGINRLDAFVNRHERGLRHDRKGGNSTRVHHRGDDLGGGLTHHGGGGSRALGDPSDLGFELLGAELSLLSLLFRLIETDGAHTVAHRDAGLSLTSLPNLLGGEEVACEGGGGEDEGEEEEDVHVGTPWRLLACRWGGLARSWERGPFLLRLPRRPHEGIDVLVVASGLLRDRQHGSVHRTRHDRHARGLSTGDTTRDGRVARRREGRKTAGRCTRGHEPHAGDVGYRPRGIAGLLTTAVTVALPGTEPNVTFSIADQGHRHPLVQGLVSQVEGTTVGGVNHCGRTMRGPTVRHFESRFRVHVTDSRAPRSEDGEQENQEHVDASHRTLLSQSLGLG